MISTTLTKVAAVAALPLALVLLGACGDATADAESPSATTTDAAVADPAAVEATGGNVIDIEMHAASFEPNVVEARQGDVLRFVNVVDVHNISWPAAKNPAGASLPAASPFLTAAGDVHEVRVSVAPGEYHFQCDPHVPMGMVGTLTVVE